MKIHYSSKKLEKILSDSRLIQRHHSKMYQGIVNRLTELNAVSNLSLITCNPPPRKHKLSGDYQGCWSVDISKNFRLIFSSFDTELTDEVEITEIIIQDIKDYH